MSPRIHAGFEVIYIKPEIETPKNLKAIFEHLMKERELLWPPDWLPQVLSMRCVGQIKAIEIEATIYL